MSEKMDRRRFLGRSASVVGGASLLGAAPVAGASLMGSEQEHASRNELESRLVMKAWEDPNFKRQLMQNPHAALARELRVQVPRDVQIQVLEESSDTVYFVLPQNPNTYLETKEMDPRERAKLAMGVTVKTACQIPSTVMAPGWFFAMGFYERPDTSRRPEGS